MPQLNDTQSILLSKAAQRGDYSLYPLADGHARGGARIDKAIAQLKGAVLVEERETNIAEQVGRTDGDLRYGLYATASGLAAIGIEPEGAESGGDGTAPTIETAPAGDRPRRTKSAAVVALLTREQGATLPELMAATGWLPHSTRAALTGLRKKGHAVSKIKRDGVTCYRIGSAA